MHDLLLIEYKTILNYLFVIAASRRIKPQIRIKYPYSYMEDLWEFTPTTKNTNVNILEKYVLSKRDRNVDRVDSSSSVSIIICF